MRESDLVITDRVNHRVQVLRASNGYYDDEATRIGAILSSLMSLPYESSEDFTRRVGYVAMAAVEEEHDRRLAARIGRMP